MRNILSAICIGIMLFSTVAAQAGILVARTGGPAADGANAVAVDSLGSAVLAGTFTATNIDWDGHPIPDLASQGLTDILLLKCDEIGRLVWACGLGGKGVDVPNAVAMDAEGNIYVAGAFSAEADFDPGPGKTILTSNGARDGFVAKFSPTGKHLWAFSFGARGNDEAVALAIAPDGVYVAGFFEGALDIDPGQKTAVLLSEGLTDGFVARFSSAGEYKESFILGGQGRDRAAALFADGSGGLFVSGSFERTIDAGRGHGGGRLISAGGSDVFLLRYAPDGTLRWARSVGGSEDDWAAPGALSVDKDGAISLAGTFSGLAEFDVKPGRISLVAAGKSDAFAARFAPEGSCLWARGIGGAGVDIAGQVTAGPAGSLYLTGSFQKEVDFDPGPGQRLIAAQSEEGDIFVARYGNQGELIWAHTFGDYMPAKGQADAPVGQVAGPRAAVGLSLAVDQLERILVAGRFTGSVDFDPGWSDFRLTSAGGMDAFLVRFEPRGGI